MMETLAIVLGSIAIALIPIAAWVMIRSHSL